MAATGREVFFRIGCAGVASFTADGKGLIACLKPAGRYLLREVIVWRDGWSVPVSLKFAVVISRKRSLVILIVIIR